jgi:hypothetical protein
LTTGVHHIGHVDEIAGLLAVAVDRHRLVADHARAEDADHARLAVGVLARTVDIGEPQHLERDGGRQQHLEIQLGGVLAEAVGAGRADRVLLVHRQILRGAVERAAGVDIDKLRDARRLRHSAQIDAASDVHRRIQQRLRHRDHHGRLRRQVDDGVRAKARRHARQLRAANLHLHELGAGIDVGLLAAGEIVHDED